MKKYEIIENSVEVKDIKKYEQGITTKQDNQEPNVEESFDTLEEAKESLKNYTTEITKMSGYYLITEYYIEENVYNEDNEWVDGGDIWEYSKAHLEVVEYNTYETLGTFDNINDAMKMLEEYEGIYGAYLSTAGETKMKILENNVDKEVSFTNLEEAKIYNLASKEEIEEIVDDERYTEFLEYQKAIKDAETLEELANELNAWTDVFADGREWKVKEF